MAAGDVALIRNPVAVAVPTRVIANVAPVCYAVGVAIRHPADLALVRDAVAVAVLARAAGDVALVRDAVAVAVLARVVSDVARVGHVVAVAVARATAMKHEDSVGSGTLCPRQHLAVMVQQAADAGRVRHGRLELQLVDVEAVHESPQIGILVFRKRQVLEYAAIVGRAQHAVAGEAGNPAPVVGVQVPASGGRDVARGQVELHGHRVQHIPRHGDRRNRPAHPIDRVNVVAEAIVVVPGGRGVDLAVGSGPDDRGAGIRIGVQDGAVRQNLYVVARGMRINRSIGAGDDGVALGAHAHPLDRAGGTAVLHLRYIGPRFANPQAEAELGVIVPTAHVADHEADFALQVQGRVRLPYAAERGDAHPGEVRVARHVGVRPGEVNVLRRVALASVARRSVRAVPVPVGHVRHDVHAGRPGEPRVPEHLCAA